MKFSIGFVLGLMLVGAESVLAVPNPSRGRGRVCRGRRCRGGRGRGKSPGKVMTTSLPNGPVITTTLPVPEVTSIASEIASSIISGDVLVPTDIPAAGNNGDLPAGTSAAGGDAPIETSAAGGDTPIETSATGADAPIETSVAGGDAPIETSATGGDAPIETSVAGGDAPIETGATGGDAPIETGVAGDVPTPTSGTNAPVETEVGAGNGGNGDAGNDGNNGNGDAGNGTVGNGDAGNGNGDASNGGNGDAGNGDAGNNDNGNTSNGDTANGGNGDAGNGGNDGNTDAGNGGNGDAGNGGDGGNGGAGTSALALDPANVQENSSKTGQEENDDPAQADSLTDPANFINFCTGKTLTNGLQVKSGSCNGIVMGDIPSTTNMVSSLITFPAPGEDIAANTPFDIKVKVLNLVPGSFTNPAATYYAAPQFLEGGKIVGHTHVTVQKLESLNPTSPPDAAVFEFFKGINDAGDGNGNLQATVANGLPAGFYRVCTMSSASNHQPVLMPVAQRGAQDDCQKFSVGQGGNAGNA